MPTKIPKQYDPKPVEERITAQWLESKVFAANATGDGKRFSIVIPPPNVTGALHMGHALNNAIQDIVVRHRRMRGEETLWLPGTDHAGIATQNVVEKDLASKGIRRADLGRQRFLEEVWKWKEAYGDRIVYQLQKLGCSCDWDRQRFTMDEGLSNAVREVFVRLHERNLIYRGKYVVNWCPRCQTAISDEEVDHQELSGHLWFIKYSLRGSSDSVLVATTRPETMLGDTALAVNPSDTRFRHLVGKIAIVPLAGREIPIVTSRLVDPDFGTGVVKVTPAHDAVDFLIAQELELPSVVIMAEDGAMTEEAGAEFAGMDRFHCREAVIKKLRDEKRIGRTEKHTHSVGHCQRCRTIIEPYLSDQWFIRMKPLADAAIRAMEESKPNLMPKRWIKVYLSWLHNIRDWCISRQLWWGHRIPVWYCTGCGREVVTREDPVQCPDCSWALRQDEDVLDTWFSSWLWPFSTLGWPQNTEDYRRFYPTDLLVTGYDIIFFWVARMVMAGLEFTEEIPFRDVYFTGMVKDEQGRWMSKSLGNGIDPIEMIEQYSADAVRFSLAVLTTEGQDINLTPSKFEMGRNFSNKIWNAYRFLAMNDAVVEDTDEQALLELRGKGGFDLSDRWILSRSLMAIEETTAHLERYRFSDAALSVYGFIWRDYCDWYVELIKSRLAGKAEAGSSARLVASYVLSVALRLLHPFMPFISEELWQRCFPSRGSIVRADWPHTLPGLRDRVAEYDMEKLQGVIKAVRNMRGEMNIPPSKPASLIVRTSSAELRRSLERNLRYIEELGKVSSLRMVSEFHREGPVAATVVDETEVFMPLEGLVDIKGERTRLGKELDKIEKALLRSRQKLNNQDFLEKAPDSVVAAERERTAEFEKKRTKIVGYLEALG